MRLKTIHRRADAIGNALSPTVDSRVHRTARDIDEAERYRCLASVSAGRRSSSESRYCLIAVMICLGDKMEDYNNNTKYSEITGTDLRRTPLLPGSG